jgi:hypothetical protein
MSSFSSRSNGILPSLLGDPQALADLQELEWRRCSNNPTYFLDQYGYTIDPVDLENPRKKYPELDYLHWLDDFLLTEKLLLVPKSRRVLVTWRIAGFCLWECLFRNHRQTAFLNEDLTKSCEMITMVHDIYRQDQSGAGLPTWMQERRPVRKTADTILFFDPKTRTATSRIVALEQGPDVGRMHAFSRIWMDEMQDHKHPADTWKSLQATTKGRTIDVGGQVVCSGTAKQGWWELACKDQLTTPAPRPPSFVRQMQPETQPRAPGLPHGVEIARLRESGAMRMQVHYTADPVKRSEEWYEATRKGVSPEDWSQEYEINWKSKAGKPAIMQLRQRWAEIVLPKFTPPPHWPRFATGDHGTTNPTSWHFHAIGPDGRGYTYHEYYNVGPLGLHAQQLLAHPEAKLIDVWILDGACWAQNQHVSDTSLEGQSEHMTKSIAQLYQEKGIPVIPAARNLSDHVKIAAVERVWPKPEPDQPLGPVLWHVMDNCPHLLRECEGQVWDQLSYVQKLKHNDPERLVDKDNHAFDEWCYGLLHHTTVALIDAAPAASMAESRDRLRLEIQKEHFQELEQHQTERERRTWNDEYFDDGLD